VTYGVAIARVVQHGDAFVDALGLGEQPVELEHALVETRAFGEAEAAVERSRHAHREHAGSLLARALQVDLAVLPGGRRRIDLAARPESLDDDGEPALERQSDQELAVLLVQPADGAMWQIGDRARVVAADLAHQAGELAQRRQATGNRTAQRIQVRRRVGRGQARRTRPHRVAHEAAHSHDFGFRGLALVGSLSHDPATDVAVADVAGRIDADLPPQCLQILGEGLEAPGNPLQRRRAHVFRPRKDLRDELAVVGARRCDREAAVPGHHGGDTVVAGRGAVGLERELGIVVGVGIHDAGSDDAPLGVDHLFGFRILEVADADDAPVSYRDIRTPAGQTGTVDDQPVEYQQIVLLHYSAVEIRSVLMPYSSAALPNVTL